MTGCRRGSQGAVIGQFLSVDVVHVAVEVTRSFNPPGGESPPVTLGFLINIPLKCFEY